MRKDLIRDREGDLIEVQWWEPIDFWDRTVTVDEIKEGSIERVYTEEMDNQDIRCDLCNIQIVEAQVAKGLPRFPIPVTRGSYALCPECFESMFPRHVRK